MTLLRPRSIFFAMSVATVLLTFIAWHEPAIWRSFGALCVFAFASVVLYWVHFAVTFSRELNSSGERDDYSGTPYLLLPISKDTDARDAAAKKVQLWIEPAGVLLVSIVLRIALGEPHLSLWLAFVAPCMWLKEFLNHWTAIRRAKIAKDVTDEAAERGEALGDAGREPVIPRPTRVSAQRIARQKTTRDSTETINPKGND